MGFCLLLGGCQSVYRGGGAVPVDAANVQYSVVYVIHGDGSYLYHDTEGNALRADETALAQAFEVAEGLSRAEVFIFHQQPRKRWLFLFPRKEGACYYYRGGKRVAEEAYHRETSGPGLAFEAQFFQAHTALKDGRPRRRVFLYYGHEIPVRNGRGYHGSFPEKPFSAQTLAQGLERFCDFPDGSSRLDLLVLSVCNGGNPWVLSAVSPYARFVVSSPEELHLSHMDSRVLRSLAEGAPVAEFSRRFARKAFEGLAQRSLTTVAIALYDVDRVRPFLRRTQPVYNALLRRAANKAADWTYGDCRSHVFFDGEAAGEGVEVFYRPPRFGRKKNAKSHSGWGCLREKETDVARVER